MSIKSFIRLMEYYSMNMGIFMNSGNVYEFLIIILMSTEYAIGNFFFSTESKF